MIEEITYYGRKGVFIPLEKWEEIKALNFENRNLLTKYVRSVDK